ncbi:MAG TPA: deoxyribose-phosphate aldolase [Polyangiaceae bacterium]|nr:deoxyribose-phosphate aldolase [Polyangiaceae bacterium]
MPQPTAREVASLIDHALLAPHVSEPEIEAGLALARRHSVASVCIVPWALPRAVQFLKGSPVRASTTIGFPHGAVPSEIKRHEAEWALVQGAEELDMVVNLGLVTSGRYLEVERDIAAVLEPVRAAGKKLKVIFENAYLNQAQKAELCRISNDLRVDWVKTSTGFGPSGATLEDLKFMREHAHPSVQVKASAGVRNLATVLAFRPYVTRIGTSHTAAILAELEASAES